VPGGGASSVGGFAASPQTPGSPAEAGEFKSREACQTQQVIRNHNVRTQLFSGAIHIMAFLQALELRRLGVILTIEAGGAEAAGRKGRPWNFRTEAEALDYPKLLEYPVA